MRIGLGVEETTCVAVVHRVYDDAVEVDLLDEIDFDGHSGSEFLLFAPGSEGLHYWRAVPSQPQEEQRLSLRLLGPGEMTQRRQHQRFAVDLPAQIRRVSGARRNAASEVHVIDLSHGGAKVVGTTPTDTGDTVIINLDLGRGPLVATARVAMAYPDGEGRRISHLAFTPPEESTAALADIERYLATLTPPELSA